MRKTILFILLIWLSFYISGCDYEYKPIVEGNISGSDHEYNLIIEDSEYIVLKPVKTRFVAGDNIEIKTIILDDIRHSRLLYIFYGTVPFLYL